MLKFKKRRSEAEEPFRLMERCRAHGVMICVLQTEPFLN